MIKMKIAILGANGNVGTDYLLADSEGKSHISFQDYAVALFDEIEKGEFIKKAFTVGY